MVGRLTSVVLACANEPDKNLSVAGAAALAPALKKMSRVITLDLSGESRMTHACAQAQPNTQPIPPYIGIIDTHTRNYRYTASITTEQYFRYC